MTVKEKERCLFEEGICLRCFSHHHLASVCKENVKGRICGSRKHTDLLYLSSEERKDKTRKVEKAANTEPNVNAKYTAICKDASGGPSCGKIMLVDIFREEEVHRDYAILDDQSNALIISTELADRPEVEIPSLNLWR